MGVIRQQSGQSRAGARRRRSHQKPMSEINVTPMVDVMLVLLIIFMVAAPLLTVGVPLELPKTRAQALPTEQEEPLTINLDAEGKVYIQKTEVDPDNLVPADRTLDYGVVMQIMGALSAGGFRNIGLVTDQPDPTRSN
jgi:biopolymer transport protein TolR